jgi:hypothetical protein
MSLRTKVAAETDIKKGNTSSAGDIVSSWAA